MTWLIRYKTPLNYSFPERSASSGALEATAQCGDDDAATDEKFEGPFYVPSTPLRSVLRQPDTIGTPLVIAGRVLSTDCRPIPSAVLDVWNCDGNGVYDMTGFNLRGHQFTDDEGRFRIETVKPRDYRDFIGHRAPHVHVKVQGRETSLLTTQLFFPGEPLNEQDLLFEESLQFTVNGSVDGSLHASFDFVLKVREDIRSS